MKRFIEKHGKNIIGVLSGFDRLIFKGGIKGLMYERGMAAYLNYKRILLKDFKGHALSLSAELKENTYDPENDGFYLSGSLGVHEHWDVSIPINSSERYSGPLGQGIDFVPIGLDDEEASIVIIKPAYQRLYLFDTEQSITILWKEYTTFPVLNLHLIVPLGLRALIYLFSSPK